VPHRTKAGHDEALVTGQLVGRHAQRALL